MAKRIDIETLLSRYAAGERDFSNLVVDPTFSGKVIDLTGIEDPTSYLNALPRDNRTQGVDLSDINLSKSNISARFHGAILRRANLRDAVWQISVSEDIDFTSADMRGTSVNRVVFVRCNFTDVICDEDTSMFNTAFYGCDGDDFDRPILYETRYFSIDEWRR
jgi:hypothetical protein